MNTRRETEDAPLSQALYLRSREFAELRGLSGVDVAAKAALLDHPAKRSLLWFLQALSLEQGGLKKVAADLVTMFPDRLGSPTMHRRGISPQTIYGAGDVRKIRDELEYENAYPLKGECAEKNPEDAPFDYCDREDDGDGFEVVREGRASKAFARAMDHYRPAKLKADAQPEAYPASAFITECRQAAGGGLASFLIDLCINPRVRVMTEQEIKDEGHTEPKTGDIERAVEKFPSLSAGDFTRASGPYFRDIIGALYEFQQRYQERVRADFVETETSRKVWRALDFPLKARGMVLVDGLEGRGKSESARAWCRLHLGEARYVSLTGITGRTNLFRTICKALGIACGRGYAALEMQSQIEDVLHWSGLVLVIDEAHFLVGPKPRMYAQPDLLDWVDTALFNKRVPVGLVTTPQFLKCVHQAAEQTGWNYRQFRRRTKVVSLPLWNPAEDLQAVARKLLPGIAPAGIEFAVGYATQSKRDMSGLSDVALNARQLAQEEGREAITFKDVKRAVNEELMPSDAAFEKALNAPARSGRQHLRSPISAPLQAQCSAAAEPANSDADSAEEALAAEDFPQRDTRPANLDQRNVGAHAVPGSHRQTHPALAPV